MNGISSGSIERARRTPIQSIIEELGVKLRGRVECVGPCPICGGTDRFSINVKKQVFNCRGCGVGGDVIGLVEHLEDRDFRSAVERLCGSPIDNRQPASEAVAASLVEANPCPLHADDEVKRALAHAARIRLEMRPLISAPTAMAYLHDVRKIDVAAIKDVLSRSDAIGWHDRVYFNQPGHPLHAQRLGCIVGVMTDVLTAQPTGAISRTYIAHDLTKIGRAKTLGLPTGIVRVSPDEEVLTGIFLAEGLETALAGMSIGLRSMWAAGSTSLMARFPPLSGIEALNLLVDHDANGAGERAAREVETRWRSADREVNLLRSDALGDLNDALKGTH
jgi:CHC2 zinc finger/Toprim domain